MSDPEDVYIFYPDQQVSAMGLIKVSPEIISKLLVDVELNAPQYEEGNIGIRVAYSDLIQLIIAGGHAVREIRK